MTTITTRAGKGSQLTWTEVDGNFTNLNTDKLEHIVQDTTPQLGGNLDVNGQQLVSTSNGNIVLAPNGTGRVSLDGVLWPATDGSNGQVLTTNGSGSATWASPSGGPTVGIFRTSQWNAVTSGSYQNNSESWTTAYNSASITIPGNSQFTFPAGTYAWRIVGAGAGLASADYQLWNATTSSSIASWTVPSSNTAQCQQGTFTFASTTTVRLRSFAPGNPNSISNPEFTFYKTA